MAGDERILALDAGTSSAKAFLFDRHGGLHGEGRSPLPQHYPRPGWVEHDPGEIWTAMQRAIRTAIQGATASRDIAAIGIANQRETVMLWDRDSGTPLASAIVWQDRRTAPIVEQMDEDTRAMIRRKTGLIPDAYFSATKLQWLLDRVPGARKRARRGDLAAGTVDTWLIWKLTDGEVHATDRSNASRTMLYDIHRYRWDDELLEQFDVPAAVLPMVYDSSHRYGHAVIQGCRIPITGCAGDQQAALYGQRCTTPGMVKNTYGTGNFVLMCMEEPCRSDRLLSTIAWSLDGRVTYALEGSVFATGAGVRWLQRIGLFDDPGEIEALASTVDDTDGVYLVPAFAGLGAPYWDAAARGTIVGLSGCTGRASLARASLEAIAYLSQDVIEVMETDAGIDVTEMRVDGGGSRNEFLLQFQADLSRHDVLRPRVMETTALGAAMLAGLEVDMWRSRDELDALWREDVRFTPVMDGEHRDACLRGWRRAVERARSWAMTQDMEAADG